MTPTEDTPTQGHYTLTNPPQVFSIITIDRLEEILKALMNSVTGDGKYKRLPTTTYEQAHAEITELFTTAQLQLVSELEGKLPKKRMEAFSKHGLIPVDAKGKLDSKDIPRAANTGFNEALALITANLEHKKQELERGK